MADKIDLISSVTLELHGARLDQALSVLFSDYSRSKLKDWVLEGKVTVDGKVVTVPKEKVFVDQELHVDVVVDSVDVYMPQEMDLNILYEDEDLLVLDKPAGLTVHPIQNELL